MELTIFVLAIALILLAFAYRRKSAALRAASSIFSISSMRKAGLQKMSLHSYWTALAMAVMKHRECSFEQATVLLLLGDAHPDIDWDEINKTHKELTELAAAAFTRRARRAKAGCGAVSVFPHSGWCQ